MTQPFAHLAQRLFNVPLAIAPGKAEVVMASLANRLGIATINGRAVVASAWDDDDEYSAEGRPRRTGYDVVAGVAVIQIEGTLVHKLGTLRPYSGMTGYDGIRQNFLTALADPAVRAIVLDIHSPGGEVSGCFDLVDTIYKARGIKPVWSILGEMAYSAAYALASAADVITVPRTGGTGSIGVITMHVDWSRALDAAGLHVTFIQYGDHKSDAAAEKPLDPKALERIQSDIDKMGELFVNTVARNRGLAPEVVRNTQADIYLGADGVELGLANMVCPPDAAFSALLETLGATTGTTK